MRKLRFVLTAILFVSLVFCLASCGSEYDSGDDVLPTVKYDFSYSVNNDAYGTLTCRTPGGNTVDAGKVAEGTVIQVRANAKEGYGLEGIYVDGNKVSSSSPFRLTIEKDTVVSAVFVAKTYAFSYDHIGVDGAEITSDVATGKVAFGTRITLSAGPKEGYDFIGWFVVDEKVSDSAVYAFDMPARSVKVVARYKVASFLLSAAVSGSDATIDGVPEGAVAYNATVTLKAGSPDGYVFTGWFENGEKVSGELTYSFKMPARALSLTAKYEISEYAFLYFVEGAADTAVTSDVAAGTAACGRTITLNASEVSGSRFDGWYEGSEKVSGEFTYSFEMPARALSLTAKYVSINTVNFYDGADLVATVVVDSGKTVDLPEFKKANYVFEGWFEDAACSEGKKFDGRAITVNMNLYAKTEPVAVTYEVVFVDHDGSEKSVQTAEEGNTVSVPAYPSRKGYKCEGWFIDGSTDAEMTEDTPITRNMTVVAVYSKEKYDVTFFVDDSVVSVQKVEYMDSAKIPQTPQKEGYIFVEWRLDGYAFDFASKIDEPVELSAYFEVAPATAYTVRFFAAEGDEEPIDTQMVEEGESAKEPQRPEKTGLVFKAWDKSFDNVTADTDVYATYETARSTVTFSYYEGSEIKETKVEVVYGEGAVAPVAERTGYTFAGWDKEFGSVTEDMLVTAQYVINTYSATFVLADGVYTTEEDVAYGGYFHVPATPEVAGYSFIGWFKAGDYSEAFDFGSIVTSDAVIYGKLEEIVYENFTVTFLDWNGSVISEQTVVEGGFALVPGSPAREGHVFVGWGKDSAIVPDGTFDVVTQDITVTAAYNKIRYTVAFYKEDGTTKLGEASVGYGEDATGYIAAPEITGKTFIGWSSVITSVKRNMSVYAIYAAKTVNVYFFEADGALISVQTAPYGGTASVPSTPVKEGYIFKGWYTDNTLETRYDFNSVIEDLGGVSVYAKWEKKSGVYTVYFKNYDGDAYGNPQKVVAGYFVTAPSAPVKDGVEFGGWYDESTGTLFDVETTPITQSITLVARAK